MRYIRHMPPSAHTNSPRLSMLFHWRRVLFCAAASVVVGLLVSPSLITPVPTVLLRAVLAGMLAMLAFGIFEQWPARLPPSLARWVLQLLAIVLVLPIATLLAYWLTVDGGLNFGRNPALLRGYLIFTFAGILVAPWLALGAMVRQREALARHQALSFALERSELERQALDARMRLLRAQVEPHFLFNTLANVQALVDTGSPQASRVLESLIAYLRSAVPQLQATSTTLGAELQQVRAYLEVMQMRMPDRLRYHLRIDDTVAALSCPPLTLLTLVENAVRHGIDPGEAGGVIEIDAAVRGNRCVLRVVDSGVGLLPGSKGLGTGLASLRERLQLAFGGDAQLRLSEVAPHGVAAEVEFPARSATP